MKTSEKLARQEFLVCLGIQSAYVMMTFIEKVVFYC